MLKNNTYVSEGGPIQTYRSIFIKNTSGKNSLGLTNSRYNELFSGSLQSSLYRDSTVNGSVSHQELSLSFYAIHPFPTCHRLVHNGGFPEFDCTVL